jgi:cytochrome c553
MNGAPDAFWHMRQLQMLARSRGSSARYLTRPHWQPPTYAIALLLRYIEPDGAQCAKFGGPSKFSNVLSPSRAALLREPLCDCQELTTKNPAVTALPAPDGLTVCRMCQQPNFEGGLPAPRLAGQSYDYLLSALNSFADGTRDNNADMVKLMQATTPAQRETIARYLSSL